MSMPRHNAKRDESEPAIIAVLERVGFSVYRLDKPVDLLCGFRGRNYLVEVKTGTKGYGKGLNANQQSFADDWRGSPVFSLHSVDDAVAFSQSVARGVAP
ncbi:hypothetical protein GB928_018450 [Shinella curvata]|uniref:VRR-NUC domain-containing protein n=1 Tax=Shinella curvata TaxID=1817964 RepID=A0ABT8XHM1_9HYPH|nr:hypothetical protein [Shinella curvata]MCJ8053841.1 hypothetical protein [Shinella curvata]MDO6123173.1 hypothetical protein [Shinella curvata]